MGINLQEAVGMFQQGLQKAQSELSQLTLAAQIMQAQGQRIQQLEDQLKASNITPMIPTPAE